MRRLASRKNPRPARDATQQHWWSLPASTKDHLSLLAHGYLESFRTGEAQEEHFSGLRSMCRVAHLAASAHYPEHAHIPQSGLNSIESIKERHARTGKWGMSGPELTAIGDTLNLMDQLMIVVRRVDMAKHVKAVLGA